MGTRILGFIGKIFGSDEVKATASEVERPVENVPMVAEETIKAESNKDQVHVCSHHKNRNEIYARLEEFCAEYRVELDLLKEMNFLEEIAGTSHLEELSKYELDSIFIALDTAMTRDWKALWKERDREDVEEIIYYTKRELNRDKVDGSWVGQKYSDLTTEKTLAEELVAEGVIDKNTDLDSLSDEEFKNKVREYVQQEFLGDLDGKSERRIQRKYNRAKRKFAYFVNKFQTDREKAILAAAIDELDSASKTMLSQMLYDSCGCDCDSKAEVARSLFEEVDTTRVDALGESMTQESSTEFYESTVENMSKADATEAVEEMKSSSQTFIKENGERVKDIKARKARGESLSTEEEALLREYENKHVAFNAGASVAIPQNENFTPKEAQVVVENIIDNAKKLGIETDVLETIVKYIDKNPNEFSKMSKKEFEQLLNTITDNRFSQIASKSAKNKTQLTSTKEGISRVLENNNETNKCNDNKAHEKIAQKVQETQDVQNAQETQGEKSTSYVTAPEKHSAKNGNLVANVNEDKSSNDARVAKQSGNNRNKKDTNNYNWGITYNKDFASYVKADGQIEGFKAYKKEFGEQEAISEAIANIDVTNENYVKKAFLRQDVTNQVNIIKKCGTDLSKPLDWAKDATIMKLDGEILSCSYATKAAQEAVDKLYEEKQA